MAALPDPATSGGLGAAEPPTPCVGVLFVHGAGDHTTGSTLIEFGQALIGWLDGWLRQGVKSEGIATDRAQVGTTQILVREGDQAAPAHSYVRLEPQSRPGSPVVDHTWLLAESHWDDAFKPPGTRQVLLWAISIVPWVLITQFIGPLQRRAALVPQTPFAVFGYLWRVIVALSLSLVAIGFVIVLTIITLVLSILPIDALRDIVSKLQRFVEGGVGDLYVVLTSPIERAALTGAVQRDIQWLRDRGCDQVALVAHSQGGFISYQALTDPWHSSVDLYITFGSGLIRLTEADYERRNRGDLLLALIGTIGALVAIRFLPATILTAVGIFEPHQAGALMGLVGALAGLALVLVLWRYFHRKVQIQDLPTPIPWIDLLTTEDPVMNRRRKGILPERVNQVRVQNEGSLVADHGGYWHNSDEFVPQVALAIAGLDPNLRLLTDGPKPTPEDATRLLFGAYAYRHGRVSALRARGSIIVAATLAVIGILLLQPGQLDGLGQRIADWFNGLPGFLTGWIPDFAEWLLPIQGIEMLILGSAAIALLSFLGISIGSALWNQWGSAATDEEFRGVTPPADPPPADPPLADPPPARPPSPPAPFSRQATMFYGWILVQLIILAVVAIKGPLTILDTIGSYAGQADQIVEAWVRQYVWTLVVGVLAAGWVLIRGSGPDARWRILGGVVVGLVIELGFALWVPGPTDPIVGLALGFGIGFLSILLVWLAWPYLIEGFALLRSRVERSDREPLAVYACPASVIDYVGSIGVLIALLALFLVLTVPASVALHPRQLWLAAVVLGCLAILCGLALALNKARPCDRDAVNVGAPDPPAAPEKTPTRGMQAIRMRTARAAAALEGMTSWGSPPAMRLVGVQAMVLGAIAVVVAVYRLVQG
jgi:hypothetical protein